MVPKGKNALPVSLLYVEDDPETQEILSAALIRKIPALWLDTARNGEEGLALYRKHTHDIVITDINMPLMDGIRMSTEIKAINSETIIIAMTARSDACFQLDAVETGINYYVPKPIIYGELFSIIAQSIATVSLRRYGIDSSASANLPEL